MLMSAASRTISSGTLNESPSEKEGKSGGQRAVQLVPVLPSMKALLERKGNTSQTKFTQSTSWPQ